MLIDGLFELFHAGIANPSQEEIFRKVLLGLFDASIDIIMGFFPILKEQMNDRSMI